MGYSAAINKAWEDLAALNISQVFSIRFLADEYSVDHQQRAVSSLSCNVPAKDFVAVLILHYLIQKIKGLPELASEWAGFKEVSAIEGYYPAFKKRAIEPIVRKYGANPEGVLSVLERLPAKRINQGDIGIVVEAFEKVPALITLWRGDEEFGPEANVLFDRSITRIFCAEDIVVLAGLIASQI